MQYAALLTFATALCAPAPVLAIELAGDQVSVTPEERHLLSQCHRQGGCMIVSQAELLQALQYVQQQTIQAAAIAAAEAIHAAERSCKRGAI